jgi:hypothetical protein
MDLARVGHEIDDLNPFEMRRLENEQLLLDHLASYETTWVNEKFKELTKSDLTHKFFLKHLELELRNITE